MQTKDLTVGKRVKYYRMLAGLTQNELAEKTDYHITTVSLWERDLNVMRTSAAEVISDAFCISLSELINGSAAEVNEELLCKNMKQIPGRKYRKRADRLGKRGKG